MKQLLVLILMFVVLTAGFAQERRLRLVEWNVENLFDTLHDYGHNDQEFLPEGTHRWNSQRYFSKISLVARTLAILGGTVPADLVVLCEVENDSVMVQLTRRSLLASLGYDYVMTNCKDSRGIDVALMYQPSMFRPMSVQSLSVPYDSLSERPTRDILFVSGEITTGEVVHLFLCHFPSRSGERRATESYRMRAASVVKSKTDSLMQANPLAKIVITGDFNDEPHDASIAQTLGASVPPPNSSGIDAQRLYVLSARLVAGGGIQGTYKYRGRWNRLDNVIVSGSLLAETDGIVTSETHCAIGALPHLLEEDGDQGAVKPRRSFLGPAWHGGVSDHLPLVLDMFY